MKKSGTLSLIIFIAGFFFCSFNSNAQGPSTPSSGSTATPNPYFIPVDTANKMLRSYLTSIDADVDTTKQLQSLIMDADAIREYLSDTSIKKVKIMFAHTLEYINSGHEGQHCGYTSGELTIILGGYDSSNNYKFAPGNLVPNRAKPCPTNCSVMGTASDMYLH